MNASIRIHQSPSQLSLTLPSPTRLSEGTLMGPPSSSALSPLKVAAISQGRSPGSRPSSRDATPCNSAPPSPRAYRFKAAIEQSQTKTFAKFAESCQSFPIMTKVRDAAGWDDPRKRGHVSFDDSTFWHHGPRMVGDVENLPPVFDEEDEEGQA